MSETLTKGEQKEIREYISAKLDGTPINPDILPQWLANLERDITALRAALEKAE